MADTISVVYQFTLPEVGGSEHTWGTKLNADLAKLEALLVSGFEEGTPTNIGKLRGTAVAGTIEGDKTLTGITTIASTTPQLRFAETDQVDPLGHYRFLATNGNFYCQKALTANFATVASVWRYIEAPDQQMEIAVDAVATLDFTIRGVAKVESTIPVLWMQDTDAAVNKNWVLWANNNSFNLGEANSTGVPAEVYVLMFEDIVTFTSIESDLLRIHNASPTIFFSDAVPGVDPFLTLSANGGAFRFSISTDHGTPTDTLVRIEEVTGLTVFETAGGAGDILAAGTITGKLAHKVDGGYALIGSYNVATYGSGSGQVWWNQTGKELSVFSSDGSDATVAANKFRGDGSQLTNIPASSVGTVAFGAVTDIGLFHRTSAGTVAPGATVLGSTLEYTDADGQTSSGVPTGTWRCQGRIGASPTTTAALSTVYRRVL